MRVKFEFHMSVLPKAYRLGILSILKEMLRQGSGHYYQQLFDVNREKMKPFAYAPYIHNLEMKQVEIVGTQLDLTVSSASYEFMMHLMNGSQRNTSYSYHGYELELKHKRLLPNPPQFSSTVTFKTLSPLLIENVHKKPLLVEDDAFEQQLNYYAQLLVKQLYDRDLFEPLHILQATTKKVVLQERLHQSQPTPIFITANHGILQLQGHPEDLKALYDMGVGRRRSLGLGLLGIEEVTYA